jgi:hypothetical protein
LPPSQRAYFTGATPKMVHTSGPSPQLISQRKGMLVGSLRTLATLCSGYLQASMQTSTNAADKDLNIELN